jgi:hypothetical protein
MVSHSQEDSMLQPPHQRRTPGNALRSVIVLVSAVGVLAGAQCAAAVAAPLASFAGKPVSSSRGVENCGTGPVLVRPRNLTVTCADNGEQAERLDWSSWTRTRATATGIVVWRACAARCADSTRWDRTKAEVTLADPVHETGKGVLFTRLYLRVTGPAPPRFMRYVAVSVAPVNAVPRTRPARKPPVRGSVRPYGTTLGYAQIEGFWDDAGGPSAPSGSYTDDQIAAAITGAESSFEPGIIQPGVDYCGSGSDRAGWGLWQITCGNSEPAYGTDFQLLDPWNNAEAAVAKYWADANAGLNGFDPWSTYTSGAYQSYLQHTAADTQLTDPGEYPQINATPPGTPASPPPAPGSTFGPPLGPAAMAGNVTYAPGSIGSVQEIFARDSSGETWENWENSSGSWSGWHGRGGIVASDITYAPGSNGSVQEIFARNSAGTVYEDWENSNGSWSGWHSLGGTMAGDITYAPGYNGSVQEIFARTTSGIPEEDWEYSGGGWSGWHSLGGTISSDMTYGSVNGQQEVWAHNSAGTVYVDVQGSSGWSGWLNLGGAAVSKITWAPGVNGAVQEVFARTSDGTPWEDVQTSSGWSGWTGLGGTISSNVTYAPGSVGSVLELFAVNSAGTPYEDWLTSSAWNGWVSRGGTLASDITYAPGSIGSLQEIFGINSAGTVYENWENSGGSWSGWHNLGP